MKKLSILPAIAIAGTLVAADDGAGTTDRRWSRTAEAPVRSGAFQVVLPRTLLGPQRGGETRIVHFSSSDHESAVLVEHHYDGLPPFASLGTEGYDERDYDPDGNLIVWRPRSKRALGTREANTSSVELEGLRIAPDGSLVDVHSHTVVEKWPVDDPNSSYELLYCRLASGRGYAERLGQPDAWSSVGAGGVSVAGPGNHAGLVEGRWELELAPAEHGLVRAAEFFGESGRTMLRVQTSGVREGDGVVVAAQGTVGFPDGYAMLITTLNVSEWPDPKVVQEVSARLAADLSHADVDVADRRDGRPVMTQRASGK